MSLNVKRAIFNALACTIVFSACSKDGTTGPTPPIPPIPPVPPVVNNITVTVTTIAGKMNDHGNAEDGQGAAARFWNPGKMVFDYRDNMLYVADGTTIRRVDAANNVTTYMPLGVISGFNEILDMDLAPGSAGGNLYITTKENDLLKISPNGNTVSKTKIIDRVYGGNATGPLNSADQLDGANGIATGKNGEIYFFNAWWNTLRKVSLVDNAVLPFAGKPVETRSGNAWPFADGQGDVASFGGSVPDITSDGDGNIYIADFRNDLVRKVTPSGQVSSLFQYKGGWGIDEDGPVATAQANRVTTVAVNRDGAAVFFTTYGKGGNNLPSLRMIVPGNKVLTLVNGNHYGDGNANTAGIETPGGIAATPDGKVIYISEPGKKLVRKVVIGS